MNFKKNSNRKHEESSIWLTIWANLAMGALGIGFSIYTKSEAILLDGLFSFVNFLIGLITLRVLKLVNKPGDDRYPFGYAIFEPMLNLAKGLIIAVVTLYALVGAMDSILGEGRPIAADSALIYAFIAGFGCIVMAILIGRLSRKTKSPIVAVDAKNWLVDALMSIAVAIAFGIAVWLEETAYSHWLPYVDPGMVIFLVLVSIPVPYLIVRKNWAQIVGRAPETTLVTNVAEVAEKILIDTPYSDYHLRTGRIGRLVYIQLYLIVAGDHDACLSVSDQDELRKTFYGELHAKYPDLAVDVIITGDDIWVQRAIGTM